MTLTRRPSRTTFAQLSILVFTLCVLCGYSPAQDFKQLHPGVEYAKVSKEISGLNVNINLLRLDLKKVRLDVHHAFDKAIGMETTSSIAKRHNGVAAINAGFFRLDKSQWAGDAAGILQIDGRLLSESHLNRIAIAISNKRDRTEVNFAHVETKLSLSTGIDSIWPVAGINRERKDNELIIFTPEFGESTLTNNVGSEYEVKIAGDKNRQAGNVIRVSSEQGNSRIPSEGYVLSVNGERQKDLTYIFNHLMSFVHRNIRLETLDTEDKEFVLHAEDITNGVSQLIKNGKIDITWQQEKASKSFVETRHPRTAVAKLKNGKFLMITVDGRSDSSGGISLRDLAEYLLSLGAVDAMNLDGGGSTTMFLDGKVVNTPSDKEGERKIGDALVVTLRDKKK